MKKLISRRNFLKVCALAGSAAALSACGGGKSTGSNNSAAAAVDVTGAVTFPLSEKVTFTGMTSFPVGSEPEPNNRTIFKRLEEQTNVHIDWTAIQSDQWSDKITLNMSNPNTLTDFVFTADFTDSNLLRYADQGVILNLEDYIDNNMHRQRWPHLGTALDRAARRRKDRHPDRWQHELHQYQVAELPWSVDAHHSGRV